MKKITKAKCEYTFFRKVHQASKAIIAKCFLDISCALYLGYSSKYNNFLNIDGQMQEMLQFASFNTTVALLPGLLFPNFLYYTLATKLRLAQSKIMILNTAKSAYFYYEKQYLI